MLAKTPWANPPPFNPHLMIEQLLEQSRRKLEATEPVDANRMTLSIYRTLMGPEHWRDMVEHLSVYTASCAVVVIRPPDSGDLGFLVSSPQNAEIEYEYQATWWKSDPFLSLPTSQVMSIAEFIGVEAWEKSEFYQVLLADMHMQHGLGVNLISENGTVCRIRLFRPASCPAFVAADKDRVRQLIPQLLQALQLACRMEQSETGNALYEGALDSLNIATLVLDENRQMLRGNQIAKDLLATADGLRLGDEGLVATRSKEQAALRTHFSRPSLGAKALSITRPSGKRNFGVVIRNVPMRPKSEGKRRPAWIVFISDPEVNLSAPMLMLGELFDLTPAESALAMKIADGCALDDAAQALGIRRNTARAHLRAIFSKTNVTRQVDLVRLILNSVIRLGDAAVPQSPSAH